MHNLYYLNKEWRDKMAISKQLCNRLARILGGKGTHQKDECSIMIKRNLNARILGKKYDTEHEIMIQSLSNGKSLNTGELTVSCFNGIKKIGQ
jgi:hypothetical protein